MVDGAFEASMYYTLATGKTLFITEFANQNPSYPLELKAQEYIRFYKAMKTLPYVGAAFAFVSSASDPTFESQSWRKENGALTVIPGIVGSRDVQAPSGTHKVVASLLNVRQHPWAGNVEPPLVRQLRGGEFVTVRGVYKTPAMEFGWACLSPNGNEWVSMKYLAAI
jgi:hypothetical protein